MKILALSHERSDAALQDFLPHLKAEARVVWELTQANILREIYFRQESHSAVLILECASAAEAKAALDTLPLVQASLISFEIMPLVPYDGLARLFADA